MCKYILKLRLVFILILLLPILSLKSFNFNGSENSCYVLRWALESLADHIFDENVSIQFGTFKKSVTIDPALVKSGDVVFARNVDNFFIKIHPKINHPYILLTAGDYLETLNNQTLFGHINDAKIIAWFAVHANTLQHPKLYPIPLGIDQRKLIFFTHWINQNNIFSRLRNTKKNKLLYINFNVVHMSIRAQLINMWRIKGDPNCLISTPNKKHEVYFQEMATCKFTLCPPGWGPDSYRVWEAILVGSIPVVQNVSDALFSLYKDLPILIVDDLRKVDSRFLEQQYSKIVSKKYNFNKLYVDYWQKKIEQVRKDYFAKRKIWF